MVAFCAGAAVEGYMGFWAFLNHWWNLPFLVMLGLCAAFVLLQALGLVGGGSDHVLDHDVPLDAGAGHDHELDAEAALGSGGAHAGSALSFWQDVLGFLGAGRVPFMVVWVSLLLCAGFAGICANRVLFVLAGGYSGFWFVPVMLGALACGVLGARVAGRVAGRFVDVGGLGATRKHDLAGRFGVVASAVLSDSFGEIRVSDARGNELLVHGRLPAGEAPLSRGASVVLVDFDPGRELFAVTACPELEAPKSESSSTLSRIS